MNSIEALKHGKGGAVMWKKRAGRQPRSSSLPLLRYPCPTAPGVHQAGGNRRQSGSSFPANADLNSDQLTDVNELLDYRDIVYNNLAVQETRLMLFQEFCALLSKPQEYSRLPVDPRRLVWVVKMHALQYPLPQLGTIEDVTILALYDAETGLHWGRTYKGKQVIDLPNPMEKVITPILKRNRPMDPGVYITVSDFPPLTEQRPANSHLSPVQFRIRCALTQELAARTLQLPRLN